jgi:peptidyl-tRNA hydrolase
MPDEDLKEDPIVLYLIVRESLNMSAGKACAQVGHAVQNMMMHYFAAQVLKAKIKDTVLPTAELDHIAITTKWLSQDARKVVLKASEKEWVALQTEFGTNCIIVKDNGLTEVAAGSQTVIALWPNYKSKRSNIVKWLSVFK